MKTAILFVSGFLLLHTPTSAQKNNSASQHRYQEETIIINRNDSDATIIELNAEGIFLNGDKVASAKDLSNKNLKKKIIINRNQAIQPSGNETVTYHNKRPALLGVFTDANHDEGGAYIARVSDNSAAEKAGLKAGDIILKVESAIINNAEELTKVVRSYAPGTKVDITYNRNGKERQTTAVLGEAKEYWFPETDDFNEDFFRQMPSRERNRHWFDDIYSDKHKPVLGISVENNYNGVQVIAVKKGSPADIAGLKEGDIITYIDDQQLNSVKELQKRIATLEDNRKIKIEVKRGNNRLTKTVIIPGENQSYDL